MADLIGKFRQMAVDYKTREALVTFAIKTELGALEEEIKAFGEKQVLIRMSEYSEKRSLTANGYYWRLVELITKKRQKEEPNLKKEEVHRQMLEDYGTWEKNEDGSFKWMIFPKDKPLPKDGYYWDTRTDVDVKGQNKGEQVCRLYMVIKGSKHYDRKEMSRLIDGAVQEAKDLDIPTIGDKEIERLLNAWGK